eukprot:Nk52_evm1s1623 gene=Nk52_evmTU1s1623
MSDSNLSVHSVNLDAYTPIGNFEKDCNEYCELLTILPPQVRLLPPQGPPFGIQYLEKKAAGGEADSQEVEPIQVEFTHTEDILTNSKVYVYCDEDSKTSPKELSTNGFEVSPLYMKAITRSSMASTVTLMNFWNAGLNDESIEMLAKYIPTSQVKALNIEYNSQAASEMSYSSLIKEDSPLGSLSLKGNNIGPQGTAAIGEALKKSALRVLNLHLNKISDEGCISLADSIKTNGTMLVLCLSKNEIGDEGAAALAEVLWKYALSHEEIVARRKVAMEHRMQMADKSRRAASPDKSSKSAPKDKKAAKGKKVPEKASADVKKKDKKAVSGKKGTKEAEPKEETEENVKVVESYEEIDGKKYVTANRTLASLNLSHNLLSNSAASAFLKYIQKALESPEKSGLVRLNISGNDAIDKSDEEYQQLIALMDPRDPFYEPPPETPANGEHPNGN